MKKSLYTLFVLFFACIALNAANNDPSLWTVNGEKAAKFDVWENSGLEKKPFGWYRSLGGATAGTQTLEPTADRDGNANSALKVTCAGNNNTTWHNQLKSNGLASNSAQPDYNPIIITKDQAFYFTFWAKADTEGLLLHLGVEALLGGVWADMPSVGLTTEWTKYGFVIPAEKVISTINPAQFNIHFRTPGVRYFDDMELRIGSEIPEEEGPVGIFEVATKETPLTIIHSTNGISFSSLEGNVSVYNMAGVLVAQKKVSDGIHFISLDNKGTYIIKFTKDNNDTVIKTIVK